jgi:hypothetical protein
MRGGRREHVRPVLIEFVVWWAALVAVTVVLISSVGTVELVVAAVAAAGAAAAGRRLRRAVGRDVAPGRGRAGGAGRALAALPWSVLRGTAVLVREVLLGGARRAGFREIGLRPDARAGWTGLLLAASPDTCLIGVSEAEAERRRAPAHEGDVLHLHVLRPGPLSGEQGLARTARPTSGPGAGPAKSPVNHGTSGPRRTE